MNVTDRYTAKATAYQRFRWDYADAAIEALIGECGITPDAVVADVGSGTGMLAGHFVNRVRMVYGVEPNADMRRMAAESLGGHKGYRSVCARSDATGLEPHSVRLITVGRALHWFPPEPTRSEFLRILEPQGFLAVFSVPCADESLLEALSRLRGVENGWESAADKHQTSFPPASFYFGHEEYRRIAVDGLVEETWEMFLGRVSSVAAAPNPGHPLRSNFERSVRQVFEERAEHGVLRIPNTTEVLFGRLRI